MNNKLLRSIALGVGLSVSGCVGLAFDPGEYDRFIDMKIKADKAILLCGSPEVRLSIDSLEQMAYHQKTYAAFRSSRKEIEVATSNVSGMVQDLASRYRRPETVSLYYCQEKFRNISMGVTEILLTIGGM